MHSIVVRSKAFGAAHLPASVAKCCVPVAAFCDARGQMCRPKRLASHDYRVHRSNTLCALCTRYRLILPDCSFLHYLDRKSGGQDPGMHRYCAKSNQIQAREPPCSRRAKTRTWVLHIANRQHESTISRANKNSCARLG